MLVIISTEIRCNLKVWCSFFPGQQLLYRYCFVEWEPRSHPLLYVDVVVNTFEHCTLARLEEKSGHQTTVMLS